jgi:hypothetical protein
VKETTEVLLRQDNFNKDTGFPLSCSWYPATNMMKQRTAFKKHRKEELVTSDITLMADRLIPPIVPSAVRAETAKNILCGVNKA